MSYPPPPEGEQPGSDPQGTGDERSDQPDRESPEQPGPDQQDTERLSAGGPPPQQPQPPGPGQPGQPAPGQTPPGQPAPGYPAQGQPPGQPTGHGQPGQPAYGYDPNQPPYGYGQQPAYGYDPNQPQYGYGQQGYGYDPNQAQYAYGHPPYQGYPGGPKPEHPAAVQSLVIGVIALAGGFACLLPLVLGPWAWVKGKRTVNEIDASGGQVGGRGLATGGYICGIIATCFLGLAIIGLVILLVVAIATSTTNPS
jgi:hypothetical protein